MIAEQLQPTHPVAEFFLAPFRLRTYRNLVYLWLAFPLGLFYFVTLITGLALGAGLLLVWVGVLILLAVVLFAWALGGFERALAEGLLGARIPRRALPPVSDVGVVRWLSAVLQSPATYKSLIFLGLKFPVGFAGWLFSVAGLSLGVAMVLTPLAFLFGTANLDLWFWGPRTFGESLPLAFVGMAVLWVTLNLQNLLCFVWRSSAEWMLGSEDEVATAPPSDDAGMTPAVA
jgi:hypothetical protein